jgi:hypothetical protein
MGEVGGIAVIADPATRGRVHRLPRRAALHHRGRDHPIHVAAASSSKNAGLFLGQIRLDTLAEESGLESEQVTPGLTLLEFFDAGISGRDFAQVSRILRSCSRGPSSWACRRTSASS